MCPSGMCDLEANSSLYEMVPCRKAFSYRVIKAALLVQMVENKYIQIMYLKQAYSALSEDYSLTTAVKAKTHEKAAWD